MRKIINVFPSFVPPRKSSRRPIEPLNDAAQNGRERFQIVHLREAPWEIKPP